MFNKLSNCVFIDNQVINNPGEGGRWNFPGYEHFGQIYEMQYKSMMGREMCET